MSIKGYSTYTFHEARINKLLCKGMGQKITIDDSTNIFLSELEKNTGELGGFEALTIAFEREWQKEKLALFVENKAVYNNLLNGKFDVTDISAMAAPFETALIHFPNEVTVNCAGKQITPPALLVSITGTQDYARAVQNLYPNRRTNFIDERTDTCLSIYYPDPFAAPASGFANTVRSGLRIPMAELHKAIENPKQFLHKLADKELANAPKSQAQYMKGMESADIDLQAAYLKFIASLIIYCNANPNALRDGLPDGVKTAQITPSKQTQPKNGIIFGDDMLNNADRAIHMRKWHLRQLWADRYYNGEHKNKQAGSRIVFVKAALIGDAKAKTIA